MALVSIPTVRHAFPFVFEAKAESADRECYLNIKYPLIQILRESLNSLFLRPIHILSYFHSLVTPDFVVKSLYGKKSIVRITKETIASGEIFSSKTKLESRGLTPPSAQRLQYVIDRVETLAKKMGLGKEIRVYTSAQRINTASHGSTLFAKHANLFLDTRFIHVSDDQLDFILCHEMAHIQNNDCVKDFAFHAAAFVAEFLFFTLVSPLSLLLVEPTLNFSKYYLLHRNEETAADRKAIEVLQSNSGAVKFFMGQVARMKTLKNATYHEFLAEIKPRNVAQWNPKRVADEQDKITPSGDSRLDFNHPPLSSRLRAALAFRPRNAPAA